MTADEQRALIEEIQWVEFWDSDHGKMVFCPLCRRDKSVGHHEDCKVKKALDIPR